ncbi:MAG: porphobilinogen synthase [Candidatus Omnitrophica bacterium]|nr:porphobilinogen synthase [Candidatus Omnitrophota bacterium]
MKYPLYRAQRLRYRDSLRSLMRETSVSRTDLIMPFFVRGGKNVKKPIVSLPGNFQFSIDILIKEIKEAARMGISAVLLFGIPKSKDELGREAYASDGIIQRAVQEIKTRVPEVLVITDVCLCEYTSHGHCGVIRGRPSRSRVEIDNDATLELLAKTAVSHACAGADMVAPSAMMDGQVGFIRRTLDENGFSTLPIMAYSAKYASAFYGPFRDALESSPSFGTRDSYQMDSSNAREALREVRLDIEEGADIVMVKPALAYLDIIRIVKDTYDIPVAAYNVSGEFAMVKAAGKLGWLDEKKAMVEIITGIKRAGADIIITYHAKELAALLSK